MNYEFTHQINVFGRKREKLSKSCVSIMCDFFEPVNSKLEPFLSIWAQAEYKDGIG